MLVVFLALCVYPDPTRFSHCANWSEWSMAAVHGASASSSGVKQQQEEEREAEAQARAAAAVEGGEAKGRG